MIYITQFNIESLSGEMTALMLFYLRKDLVINTRTNFQDMGAGQHRLT
jgi:hypothetical protein